MAVSTKRKKRKPRTKPSVFNSWPMFSKWLEEHDTINWIFRGVSSPEHKLIPKIGRPEMHHRATGYEQGREIWLLHQFQRLAPNHLSLPLPYTDWDWLALAQHHGLPTRLLDWTLNPLVAAYFAVEKEDPNREDGVIHAIEMKSILVPRLEINLPFLVRKIRRFDPPHLSSRIIAQSGTFTIHPRPTKIFTSDGLEKIIIDKDWCQSLKALLNNLGINRGILFPDLDGIASDLTWQNTIRRKVIYPYFKGMKP